MSRLREEVSQQLGNGKPICLFDFPGRENETDVVYIGHPSDAGIIDFLRRDVGAPVAAFLSGQLLARLGIVTFTELVRSQSGGLLKRLVAQSRAHYCRFAISIDARENVTGCSAFETSRTIQLLYKVVCESTRCDDSALAQRFVDLFVVPGHVPVVRCADDLLKERRGHSELALTIARMLDLPEIAVAAELVDSSTQRSMTPDMARRFADDHDLSFVTGDDVIGWQHGA